MTLPGTVIIYLEVEDRPVVRISAKDGSPEVWVWSSGDGWTFAPGLFGKSYSDGMTITEAEFKARFPEVTLPPPER